MDRSLIGFESWLPDMTGVGLDAIGAVDSPGLRRALARLDREAAQVSAPRTGFNSSLAFTSAWSAL
ncbi:FxSxx-COOH cyclophane-containing RiPP peptide [Candidatus Frankia alpina]|nr:FxSxx-COOH cyclophane-containing RiPP peptide [Candidatus Frankia alpina]